VKALFIPLRTEFYVAFANGTKTDEYRLYGPRWNERTCNVGRRVVISHGYGTRHRLHGRVVSFARCSPNTLHGELETTLRRIYGQTHGDVARIAIELQDTALRAGEEPT
jgi:hypothetical protein